MIGTCYVIFLDKPSKFIQDNHFIESCLLFCLSDFCQFVCSKHSLPMLVAIGFNKNLCCKSYFLFERTDRLIKLIRPDFF